MGSAPFDVFSRAIVTSCRSRATLVTALSGLLATRSLTLAGDDAAAKKKHKHKRKKKRCRGGTKKCGKHCIPEDRCCVDADCGSGRTCVGGTCNCPSGFKVCDGKCLSEQNCCQTAECPGKQVCQDDFCLCPGKDELTCGDECCDTAADEVCEIPAESCQAGCPPTDYCKSSETFFCEPFCVCASIIDLTATTACVDIFGTVDPTCVPCNLGTPCGEGKVCIPGGPSCACNHNFCVPLCGVGTPRKAAQTAGLSLEVPMAMKRGSANGRRR